jgi:hypothetical protein
VTKAAGLPSRRTSAETRAAIDTELNPAAGDRAAPQIANTALKRYGKVDEIAAMVSFVAARRRRTSRAPA